MHKTERNWAGIDVFQTTPLNQAHLDERKAEKYIEEQKWDEASACYESASKCISKAMEKTTALKVLQSLQLQFDGYVLQKHVIEIKKTEHLLLHSTPDDTDCHGSKNKKESHELDEVPSLPFFKKQNYEILNVSSSREPDSLLQFLNPSTPRNVNQRKYPKAAPDKLEELQIQNQNLSRLVDKLMAETERLQSNNKILLKKNGNLEEEVLSLKAELKGLQSVDEQDRRNCSLVPNAFTDAAVDPHETDFSEKGFFDFDDHLTHELNIAMQENPCSGIGANQNTNNLLKEKSSRLTRKVEVESIGFVDMK